MSSRYSIQILFGKCSAPCNVVRDLTLQKCNIRLLVNKFDLVYTEISTLNQLSSVSLKRGLILTILLIYTTLMHIITVHDELTEVIFYHLLTEQGLMQLAIQPARQSALHDFILV